MAPEPLRLPLDLAWALPLEGFLREALASSPAPDQVSSQIEAVLAGGYARDLGLLTYGLGAPLHEVRSHFMEALSHYEVLFHMRGTTQGLIREGGDTLPLDHSLTNSRTSLAVMELALAFDGFARAQAFATLVWDPPFATYLGPTSVVCTLEDQCMAYSLRDLLLKRPSVSPALPETPVHAHRASLLAALSLEHPNAFLDAFQKMHAQHLDRSQSAEPLRCLEDLLDLTALAYWTLGRHHFPGLVPPPSDSTLPLKEMDTPSPAFASAPQGAP